MTEQQQAERRAKRFWISLVVLLLVLQLVVGGVAIGLATNDPSSAIVPDYHSAALNWDQTHAKRVALERLGLQLVIDASDVVDGRGQRAIRVTVTGRDGARIGGLQISAAAYHHARGNDIESFALEPIADDQYQAFVPLARKGLWNIELNFLADGQDVSVVRTLEFDG